MDGTRPGGEGIRVQILGPIRAWRHGEALDLGPASQRSVLGLLALARGEPVSRPQIVDGVWHHREPPPTAANVIHTYVKNLRRVLEPDRPPRTPSAVLRQFGDGYALRLPDPAVDLWRFRQLVADAVTAQREKQADLLASALALWTGDPLTGAPALADHPKVVALASERQAAVARYGDVMIEAGRAVEVVALLEEAAASQPWDEAAHARLIRAYRAAGRRGQAFAVFHEVRRRLADELGVAPGTELLDAHAALLPDDEEPVTPQTPAQLPPDVPDFVGRAAELADLDRLLTGGSVAVCVLSGTAGVGKTAIAVHWAHRARDRYPDGQLYVNLRGYDPDQPLDAADALAHLLTAFGVAGSDLPAGGDARAARYRTELARRRMLIVLDNAATAEQVRPLLPGTDTSTVLVTSRASLAGLVARDGAHRLELGLLPPDDAHELLGRLIGPRVVSEVEAVTVLADRCARLPLALRIAAELAVSRPATRLADLVDELADQQSRLDRLDADGDARSAVTAVFSWSIRHLRADAARTFRLLGLHPGPDFDVYAMAALTGTGLAPAGRCLDLLARAHLVHPVSGGRYGMHDLLRAYAAGLAVRAEKDHRDALDRLFDYFLAAGAVAMDTLYPADSARRPTIEAPATPVPELADVGAARRWLDTERANVVAIAGYTATHGRPAYTLRLATVFPVYLDGAHYADAVSVQRLALHAAQDGGSELDEARALYGLGFSHIRLGKYEVATTYLQRAMELFEHTGSRADAARSLSALGVVNGRTGRHQVAAEQFRRALDALRELGDGAGETNVLTNLGIIDAGAGRYQEAAEHFRQAVAVAERFGDTFRQVNSINNLARIESMLGDHDTAAGRLPRALEVYRQVGDRGGEARTLDTFGIVRTRQGRHDEAAECFDRALALFRAIGDRVGEAAVHNGLGELGIATGRPAEARDHHAAALALAVEVGHPDEEARAYAGLGHAARALDDLDASRSHFARALALYAELGSPEAENVRTLLTAMSGGER